MTTEFRPAEEDRWIAVRVELSGDRQRVIDALFAAGSLGVQEDGHAIMTHFPPGTDIAVVEAAIRASDSEAVISTSLAPIVDWSGWRASVGAHQLGRVRIRPPWLAAVDAGIDIVIDPAMAFGTGEHATTRGVVRLMQQLPEMPPFVADLGAGSAILSICAAKLGARRVAAIELDEDAIGNAEENVRVNDVSGTVQVLEGDAAVLFPLVAPVGLVLANIISSVLLDLLPLVRDSLTGDGHAILSGILLEEREMMLEAIERGSWRVLSEDTEEGWWSVLIALPQ